MNSIQSVALTQSAKDAVLYANTPSYLLERLKRDSSIQTLLHEASPEDLIEILRSSAPATSALDVARKYVLLVAVATSGLANKWRLLADLNLSDLDWGELILKTAEAQEVPTNRVSGSTGESMGAQFFKWNQQELVGR